MFSGYSNTFGNVFISPKRFNFFCAMCANVVVEKRCRKSSLKFLPTFFNSLPTIYSSKPIERFPAMHPVINLSYQIKNLQKKYLYGTQRFGNVSKK
jgi:hypothetical protein